MGRHTDPDTLRFIAWLSDKAKALGYASEEEYSIANWYDIDVVWYHPDYENPVFTFEVETRNTNSMFKNTAKIYSTPKSVVKKPWHHFGIVYKGNLSEGNRLALGRDLDYQNFEIFDNIFNNQTALSNFETHLNRLDITQISELVSSFRNNALDTVSSMEYIIHVFGEKTPYVVSDQFVLSLERDSYEQIPSYIEYLRNRVWQINREKDITKKDLDILLASTRVVERVDSNENVLLSMSICPKCGEKVGSRPPIEHYGHPEDPPHSITYVDGCLICDYELNRETISI